MTDNKKRFEVALEAAASASSFLLSHENLRHEINRKGSNDYVTLADKKCEEIIINRILESFPYDAVLGEESGKRGDAAKMSLRECEGAPCGHEERLAGAKNSPQTE